MNASAVYLRSFLAALIAVAFAERAFAQGTINICESGDPWGVRIVDAPVRFFNDGLVSGIRFVAQLYAGPTVGSLAPVGAPWIWNVAADRWAGAGEVLDFYHASEHVWELGRALYGEDAAQEWVESRLHELRHGQEEKFLEQIARLKGLEARTRKRFGNRRTILPIRPSG
jgi:hypothetical protein